MFVRNHPFSSTLTNRMMEHIVHIYTKYIVHIGTKYRQSHQHSLGTSYGAAKGLRCSRLLLVAHHLSFCIKSHSLKHKIALRSPWDFKQGIHGLERAIFHQVWHIVINFWLQSNRTNQVARKISLMQRLGHRPPYRKICHHLTNIRLVASCE